MVGRRSPPSARPGPPHTNSLDHRAHRRRSAVHGRRVRCRRSQCGVDSPRGGSPPTAPGLPGPVARPSVQPSTGRPHRGLRPQAAQHQLSGAVQPALQYEQGSSSCRARVGGRLEHYVYRNSPPGWCCQALPHQPRPPQAGLFDPGLLDMTLKPPCRTTVRPTAWLRRDLSIAVCPGTTTGKSVDQRVSAMIAEPGRRRWARGTHWRGLRESREPALTRTFPWQGQDRAAAMRTSRNAWE
jgi:hypothetical protein